jgi:dTDP-4-amino-4,6-dideoxygalactose transaminase
VTRPRIPFLSLMPEADDAAAVRRAVERVIARGWFVLGPEVDAFETEFASAMGAAHAVGVGNGTDAIALILRALDIGPGDEVITTPVSAAYTALAVMMVGARPVFADIDPSRLTVDPEHVAQAIGPRTRAILPVHLYGQPADMTALERLAARHGLALVEDCCQAHLATAAGRPVGTIGVAGAFSFYPTKNLGALGDGGAVVTNDGALAERIRRLRNGGQIDRYRHDEFGVNSRLDEMQAAILRARLPRLANWTARRRGLAARYRAALAEGPVNLPAEHDPGHVYHLFPVRVSGRAELQARLATDGIETLVHYPVPIPRQPAMAGLNPRECPEAVRACDEVLSLPLHPGLRDSEITDIVTSLKGHYACVRS